MARCIMVQGTASNAGKSLVAAGLCRIFHQDGWRVAPFKSQNMALNSFITDEGLEMGRAQVMQAEAARAKPSVKMNPILLKPTADAKSQVIVNGEVVGNMTAAEYYAYKDSLRGEVQMAYDALAAENDIIVLEGAGSPVEINLNKGDFVNMGMAKMVNAPVLLVGDIDRGGVFASLYGTIALLDEEAQARVKGLLINKFRGDVEILRPGLGQLEALCGAPVVGVLPYLRIDVDDEDSLSARIDQRDGGRLLDVVVIGFPHISNFTDFNALENQPAMGVRYVNKAEKLGRPDMLILPGSKNTMGDLAWLRESGLERAVLALAKGGTPTLGICGGYQMLGKTLRDPDGSEQGGEMAGLGLLDMETTFAPQKTRTRVHGRVRPLPGLFGGLSGCEFEGYEIHMGRPVFGEEPSYFADITDQGGEKPDGLVRGNVLGSYVHGLFDSGEIAAKLAQKLLEMRGLPAGEAAAVDNEAHKQREYDKLADAMRQALDMESIYRMMG